MGEKTYCYVGNWGMTGGSIGITVCEFDLQTGTLTPVKTQFPGMSVGAQCIDYEQARLYVADEKKDHPEFRVGGGGEVHSLAIDKESGELTMLGSAPSFGTLASYVAVDPKGKFLVATNHGSGNYVTRIEQAPDGSFQQKVLYDNITAVLYELNDDGSIAQACDVYYALGDGPMAGQLTSHLHSVEFAPDGSFFLICDKGGDQVLTFRIDRDQKKMVLITAFSTEKGIAPRYSAFHPTKPFVYTNNELKNILHCFRYQENGELELLEVHSGYAQARENEQEGSQSALRVSPDGKFLYSLVRGTNVVSVFAIDQDTGLLTPVQQYEPKAKNLRGATISPDGRFLVISAVESQEIVCCPIGEDGLLGEPVCRLSQPTPCCVAFF